MLNIHSITYIIITDVNKLTLCFIPEILSRLALLMLDSHTEYNPKFVEFNFKSQKVLMRSRETHV